ncbi:MAG: hypothetical protein Q9N34_10395 [Aquificota bacterium]|nr:hypothetical protein [Aquificota bacterium]
MGKLHPKIASDLELEKTFTCASLRLIPLLRRAEPLRGCVKISPVIRDLALVVDKSLSVSKLLNEIKSHLSGKVEDVMVFDLYAGDKVGEGKKSVGVRVVLRSLGGSLSGEEVNGLIEDLVRRLKSKLGAQIR